MSYNWDDVPDADQYDKIPEGKQTLQLFTAYKGINTNNKRFLMFKFCEPNAEVVKDKKDRYTSYPHATLQIFPDAKNDFGKKVMKNLLKNSFGEDELKNLDTDDKIINAIENKKPLIIGNVYYEGNYTKCKEFGFEQFEEIEENESEEGYKVENDKKESEEPEDDLPF